ncbi:glycerophosphodiester phosphodiesterase [Paenibacillus sp. N1-5-1-14]|uniref:glycerophosphodiester phosphodiesterase n=1 Tax=Paenibacillus radicibacter TaxID=2972488 RepID=UPI0021594309|nr:glycerophosphodiester phosphodiesterase [Paenibacillus radicibacter]MCR8645597.1 glycerophosphodiester phosphodiesterase [Paenibacillus radicibacter]
MAPNPNTPEQPIHTRSRKNSRKRITLYSILGLIVVILAVHTVMYYGFVPKQKDVYVGMKKPLNIAHQGGEDLAPSNTMAAFAIADSLEVDALETDIHMTKDGHLVTIHDATVDRTTNGKGRVDSYTLAELQKLDAGYHFKDLNGQYSYRGKGVYIPTLDEVFAAYGSKYYFTVEIKESYPIGKPSEIEQKLWDLIRKYKLEDKVIMNSFDNDIVSKFSDLSGNRVPLGAGKAEVIKFVIANKLFLPGFYRPSSQVLQIPTEDSGFNLSTKRIIENAHRLNMQVHYWTIDDKPTMKKLIELGADGIMSNRPDLLKEVIEEMGLK